MDVKKLMAEGSLDNLSEDLFKSVSSYSEEVKAFQRQKAAEYADQVVAALKKIEQDIKDRYDRVGLTLEKRVLNIKDGKDGINGRDGRDGKDGKPGAAGLPGRDGKDGKNGRDGVDGKDGVSVVNAFLDFDNSLVIELSNGKQVNAGAILGADFAEKVKIIANGGGTSQGVIDTLASLQAQIDAISSIGFVEYQGTWNASTNTPTITASVGTKGYYYVVSVAGTTSINGESKWGVGDWIVFNGSAWQKVDGGSTGNLTTLDVSGAAAIGGSLTISGGTANSVAYLNGSKVLSTDGNLAFDGTSFSTGGSIYFSSNVGYYLYAGGNAGAQLKVLGYGSEGLAFKNYAGTTEYMRLTSTGLGIGTSSPGARVDAVADSSANAYFARGRSSDNIANISLVDNGNTTTYGYIQSRGNGEIRYVANGSTSAYFQTWYTAGSERLRLDNSGNLGLGVTPSGWVTYKALQVQNAALYSYANNAYLSANVYQGASNPIYIASDYATQITQSGGGFKFYTAPSGTAGNAISFTQVMTLDASGNLGIGTTSPGYKLEVNGIAGVKTNNGNAAEFHINNTNSGARDWVLLATGSGWAGGGQAGYFNIYDNTAGAQRLTIDTSGNLGIGTTSPGAKLEVAGAITSSGALTAHQTSKAVIAFNSGNAEIRSYGAVGTVGRINFLQGSGGSAPTVAMSLDSSGNLGLGVTPSAWSVWSSVIQGNSYAISGYNSAGNVQASFWCNTARTGAGTTYYSSGPASWYNQDNGKHIWYTAPSGTAGNAISFTQAMTLDASGNLQLGTTTSSGANITVYGSSEARTIYQNSTSGTGAGNGLYVGISGADALVYNYENGALVFATNGSERARIDSSGNLLVGYTSSNGSYLLQVNSQIYATNATIATSDGRYKESVQPLQNALSLISTLNPVSFKWKHHDVHNFAVGETDVGFIAQEVKQSLENTTYVNQVVKANTCTLTDGTEEEFLGIAEGKMIPLLVKAIQELKAEVDSLKAQLNK